MLKNVDVVVYVLFFMFFVDFVDDKDDDFLVRNVCKVW